MKRLLLLITLLFSGNLFAQTVKTETDQPKLGIKEKFFVLKSDKNIKDGPYAAYSRYGGKLLYEGFYKNNVRDSIWSSYGYEGELEVKYDYTHKKLLAYFPSKYIADIKTYNVINGADTLNSALDQPPIFVDGDSTLGQLYINNLRYPAEARINNVQGKVLIAITVDSSGHIANYRIKKFIGGGCAEEGLRVVKLIRGDWLPGILNGKPVTSEYILPISFTLSSY